MRTCIHAQPKVCVIPGTPKPYYMCMSVYTLASDTSTLLAYGIHAVEGEVDGEGVD